LLGVGQNVWVTAVATDQDLGKYSVTFNIPRYTPLSTTKCGLYSFSGYILKSGGLLGKYYTNKWFSGEKPYMTQIDATINKNWGRGYVIPNVAKDYVSIIWEGFLEPNYNEDYTFYVESNDGVRVIVNEKVVIDKLQDSENDLDTHLEISTTPLTLKAG